MMDTNLDLIFTKELNLLWKSVLKNIGVDPELLSLKLKHL